MIGGGVLNSAVFDLVALLDLYAGSDGFAFGVAFCILMQFVSFLLEIPFALRDLAWQRWCSHNCKLRHSGMLKDSCHVKRCPAHGTCPYYKVPDRWAFFRNFFKRYK